VTEPRHVVIGTCGHIDHGKTALVRALTGEEPDRLPEEKKRGITIELGFARWPLADDVIASVVDVPGHERFVRTMAAGAGGVDAVVLVVAADDGVMPQTEEHLAICRLLGVRRGVIALSKADLVDDEELLELVAEDVKALVAGTFLDGAEIVVTSSTTGKGLDALRAAVRKALDGSPRRADGPGLLPVDRVFTRPGFGTVVTGTQLVGTLAVGDAVDIVPGPRGEPKKATVRGVQVHAETQDAAGPGRRVALNLRGVEVDDVARGDAVCAAGSRRPVSALHGSLDVLAWAGDVKENDELSLHLGTADRLVRVIPLAREPIAAGEQACVRMVLSEPIVAFPGQRYILRKPGQHGQGTVGGGEVLDVEPSVGRRSFVRWRAVADALLAAAEDDDARVAALLIDARSEGLDRATLTRRCPPWCDAGAAAERLVAAGRAVGSGDRFIDGALVGEAKAALLEAAATLHDERPFMLGVSAAELTGRLPRARQALAAPALDALVDAGELVGAGAGLRLASRPVPAEVEAGLAAILGAIQRGGTAPPGEDELGRLAKLDQGATRDVLSELKRRGEIASLKDGLHLARTTLDELEARVKTFFDDGNAALSTADFKALSGGVSRKFAIPLLEHLDGRGVTRRDGDVRRRGASA
jgi:selenocysteine-specific elongation factor